MLLINFKNYPQVLGEAGLELAKKLNEAAKNFPNVKTVLAVSPVDIFRVSEAVDIPVLSQHVDPYDAGQTTGFVIPEAIKEAGATGALINHSEHPMSLEMMADAIRRCREVGLRTVVCAGSVEMLREIKGCLGRVGGPDFFAYEPPELIGGKVSATAAESEVILEAVEAASSPFAKAMGDLRPTPLLVGAGVHSGEDVQVALQLGAVGVLVSSDIVLAENPAEELREMLGGFGSKNHKFQTPNNK